MSNSIHCPNCGQNVLPLSRYCEHCGVDLAVAAVLAEQRVTLQSTFPDGVPIAPEALVPRIGEYMIQSGILKKEGLEMALEHQKKLSGSGKPILLGQALLELNLSNRETLDKVVTTQIIELQTALSEANQSLKQRVEERTQELQLALERLSELNHLKSNFIANISHELRTPLTHIKGYLDILSDGGLGQLNEAQTEAIHVLQRAEGRLETLIEDLIQFSLASRGELSLDIKPTNIDQVIRVTIDRINQKPTAKERNLQVIVMENLPMVNADEDKIGWVLFQLLDNALKFTPEGGEITVKAVEDNGLVLITIRDTGIGIPKERLQEIFEPFHQLDSSTTRKYSGTGLGLTMVRRIIEAHGSQIKVKPKVGQGSQFEFSLPKVKRRAAISQTT